MFSMLTSSVPFPLDPKKKASIIFTITAFISVCLPQMSRHAMVWLHTRSVPEEKRKQKQGSRGHCLGSLTNLSPVNTRSHSPADTQTGTFPAVEACFQVSNLSGSFLLLQTLNVFKMYVKITQYGHKNLHHGHNNLHHH